MQDDYDEQLERAIISGIEEGVSDAVKPVLAGNADYNHGSSVVSEDTNINCNESQQNVTFVSLPSINRYLPGKVNTLGLNTESKGGDIKKTVTPVLSSSHTRVAVNMHSWDEATVSDMKSENFNIHKPVCSLVP